MNITDYRELETVIGQDLDLAATANSLATTGFNTTYQRHDVDSEQVSTELQLKFDAASGSTVSSGSTTSTRRSGRWIRWA